VVHGKEEKKRKEKVSRSCGGVLKEDRRVLRMHAFVFLLKLHNNLCIEQLNRRIRPRSCSGVLS